VTLYRIILRAVPSIIRSLLSSSDYSPSCIKDPSRGGRVDISYRQVSYDRSISRTTPVGVAVRPRKCAGASFYTSPFKMVTVDKLDPPFSTSSRGDAHLPLNKTRERERTRLLHGRNGAGKFINVRSPRSQQAILSRVERNDGKMYCSMFVPALASNLSFVYHGFTENARSIPADLGESLQRFIWWQFASRCLSRPALFQYFDTSKLRQTIAESARFQ